VADILGGLFGKLGLQPLHLPRAGLGAYMRKEALDASLAEVADAAGAPHPTHLGRTPALGGGAPDRRDGRH
jgi:hypothetical protein